MKDECITITVRWHDGYMQSFDVTEVKEGFDLLRFCLQDRRTVDIPMRNVRWFSRNPESPEKQEGSRNESVKDEQ